MQPYEKIVSRLQSLSNCSLKIGAEAQGAIEVKSYPFSRGELCRIKYKVVLQVRKGNQYLAPAR
jgi:hypothetical protein